MSLLQAVNLPDEMAKVVAHDAQISGRSVDEVVRQTLIGHFGARAARPTATARRIADARRRGGALERAATPPDRILRALREARDESIVKDPLGEAPTVSVVVDASIGLRWFLASAQVEAAMSMLTNADICAPDLLLKEVRSVLRYLLAEGQISAETVEAADRALPELGVTLVPTDPHMPVAFNLAMRLSQPISSCVYLAVAMATDRKLITMDERFVAATDRMPDTRGHASMLVQPREAAA